MNKSFSKFEYTVKKNTENEPIQLYSYENNGKFDYNAYKEIQVDGHKKKIQNVWATEGNIEYICSFLKENLGTIQFGLCHGTRRGREQEWFKNYLGCDVLGTEISDTARDFENTIEWDFHDTKEEWIDSVDFIYSNSFDHSYDPESCINAWADCLRSGGFCIIEHTSGHEKATQLDPFGAKIQVMPYLLLVWLRGKCSVVEILEAPVKSKNLSYISFIVLQKR